MPVEFPGEVREISLSYLSSSMDTSPDADVINTSRKNKRRKKLGEWAPKKAEIVYTGGSKAVPIPAEVIQHLRDFLLSLPGSSERGLA